MKYVPLIESARRLRVAPLGPDHTALFFDDVKAAGLAQCKFPLAVLHTATWAPACVVTSEVNQAVRKSCGFSQFLCRFDGEEHRNPGASDDWGDADKLFARALAVAGERVLS